jgi:hypothetical protein
MVTQEATPIHGSKPESKSVVAGIIDPNEAKPLGWGLSALQRSIVQVIVRSELAAHGLIPSAAAETKKE